jgi:membrane protease YdiL (CAAX protease family)
MKTRTRESRREAAAPSRPDPLLGVGLTAAYAAFALTFRGPRDQFWKRMTATGLSLGSLALAARPELRRTRIRGRDVALGLGIAAGLYGVFKVGDQVARRIMPKGSKEIEEMYALRDLLPAAQIAGRLALIIAPAEELFWRGFVQDRLQRRLGTWPGAAAATAAYGGAHLSTGNLTLLGAANVAGAAWGGLYAAGVPMGALVVSHVAWDLWTFLVAPTS